MAIEVMQLSLLCKAPKEPAPAVEEEQDKALHSKESFLREACQKKEMER